MIRRPPSSTLFPTPPLSRSLADPDVVDTPNRLRPPLSAGHALGTDEFGRDLLARLVWGARVSLAAGVASAAAAMLLDRKSTRLNSSHPVISYAGFCFEKKK